jgi:DNA-binding PadR family transcriptional regulator
MSINHVILGLLSREPLSGYEIKKIVQNSPFMHWSGNNNQIYKAVAELLDEGYVTKMVQHQAGAPSKNIYSITDAGQKALTNWLLTVTEAPVFKKQILVKLALAGQLKRGDLQNMLTAYADVVRMQAALSERELAQSRFAEQAPSGSRKFMDLIRENVLDFYASERQWIRKAMDAVAEMTAGEAASPEAVAPKEVHGEGTDLNYRIQENRGRRFLHFTGGEAWIQREQDAIDIISLCAEHDTNAVVLDGKMLSDDFVQLRTGLAGAFLQKLGNYNIKAAVIMAGEQHLPARFREMVAEHRTGRTFRIFDNLESASDWLFA